MSQDIGPQLAQRVLGQSAYRPPLLEGEIRLRLDRNEGRGTLEQLGVPGLAEAQRAELARRYPQTAGLQGDVAATFGVGLNQVLITAGGDEIGRAHV